MKLKLTKEERLWLMPKIMSVLETGEPWDGKDQHFPAGAIISAVLSIKGMKPRTTDDELGIPGFSTNGWQWDWWQAFSYKGKSYMLSGSGYHGGHTFELDE